MTTKKAIIGVVTLGVFAFAYYAVSPLLRTIKVDDQAPTATSDAKISAGTVTGTTGHPASGMVSIVRDESHSYVRYENLKTINGPDVYVYLANDLEAKDFVSIGKLKATDGNVNYQVPPGVDASKYRYVMMWCKQFGVLFNYADISQK